MARSRTRISTIIFAAAALGITLSACGSEEEATSTTGTVVESVTENPSAPVVAGPKPKTSDVSLTEESAVNGAQTCGKVGGPDGSLTITIAAGSVTCGDAKKLAESYSPKIATGQPQTVDGWACGPDATDGALASCKRGDAKITFVP